MSAGRAFNEVPQAAHTNNKAKAGKLDEGRRVVCLVELAKGQQFVLGDPDRRAA